MPGPRGSLWFTEDVTRGIAKIGRITTLGVVGEYPVPTPGCAPTGIAAGPDGRVWFTEFLGNKIGALRP